MERDHVGQEESQRGTRGPGLLFYLNNFLGGGVLGLELRASCYKAAGVLLKPCLQLFLP
jgi:hypothetical protein